MGFDENTKDRPLIEPRKKSTRVNFWIAASIVAFLLIGGFYYFHTASHQEQTQNEVQQHLQH